MGNIKLGERNLLIIGHPGHELRIHGWVASTQPLVCILTDGSGGNDAPRLHETLKILHTLGAEIGPVCGEFSDRQIYEQVLNHRHHLFETLCERLAELIVLREIDTVVSDGIEGYNPTHDLCEVITRVAVATANSRQSRVTRHYTIPLMGDPRPVGGSDESTFCSISLDSEQFQQKLDTVRSYVSKAGPTLQQEVDDTFRTFGELAFAREYLFAAATPGHEPERRFMQEKPYYETYGEKQVAAGRYQFVIRFHEHILPLMNRLRGQVLDTGGA